MGFFHRQARGRWRQASSALSWLPHSHNFTVVPYGCAKVREYCRAVFKMDKQDDRKDFYGGLKVQELKQILRSKGAKLGGRKAELVDR